MSNWWRIGILLMLGGLPLGCGNGSAGDARGATSPSADRRAAEPGNHSPAADHRAAAPKPQQVFIDNFAYDPPTLTVAPGTRVTWVNRDDVPHTATSSTRPRAFDSGALDTDMRFSHTFTTPGTYDYFCAVHPKMTGRIIVK